MSLKVWVSNDAATTDATALAFADTFPAGLIVAASPNSSTTCGGSISASSGAASMSFSGGTAAAGATWVVNLDVTAATAGSYANTSGDLTSSLGNSGTASYTLEVVDDAPAFTKVFAPDAILTGGTSTLTFTIDNSMATTDASALAFTDAFPSGMTVASTPNIANNCGGTLTAPAGADSISLSGGTAAAVASCEISLDVTASPADTYANMTGDLTSSLGNSGRASDTLNVTDGAPVFSKAFSPGTILVDETSTLIFTIDHTAATTDATDLDFTDNLPAGLSVATPANATTTCTSGTVTAASGGSSVSYTGGTLTAGASCTVQADVTASVAGDYDNVSGNLTSSLGDSGAASATLAVTDLPPVFSKAFSPDTIGTDEVSTLTFTIDNTSATSDVTDLQFIDALPTGLTVAATPNASTTCTGGTLTAPANSTSIGYANGTAGSGVTCEISVDVAPAASGVYANVSGNLTSSHGNSGTADATLTVNDLPPDFTKQFSPDTILAGETSTLSFSIDNTGSTSDATALEFTDDLPTGLTIAPTPNASTSCTGGTLVASAGSTLLSYSGGTAGAGISCEVAVDVTATDAGAYANTSGSLTSSLGDSGTATDTLTVDARDVSLDILLEADTDPIVAGSYATFTVTISNSGSDSAPNSIVTVTLPTQVTFQSSTGCAEDPSGIPTCTLGDIPAGGSVSFSYTVLVDDDASGTLVTEIAVSSDVNGGTISYGGGTQTTAVATPAGTITIVKNTSPAVAGDGTFEFSSTQAALDAISLTTINNTASTGPLDISPGTYTLSEDVTEGWRLDSIECTGDTDGGSSVNLDDDEVTIDLDNDEAVVCTCTNVRDEDAVIERTQQVIVEFMEKRADQITSNGPDLTARLRDRGSGDTGPGTLYGFANPLTSDFSLSTSVSQMSAYRQSLMGGNGTPGQTGKLDAWMEARFAHNTTDTSHFHFGALTAGVDYLVNPDLLLGGLVQFDWAGLDNDTLGSTVDGWGWMAGPYVVARPWQNIYVDGRVAWGQSYNEVNPFGTYTDDFDTTRWLASAKISGDYKYGGLTVRPGAEFIYFSETQHSYVDSLAITIPNQTLSLGRLIVGPEFGYQMLMENGVIVAPTLAFEGIWDLHETVSATSTATTDDKNDLRGRVNLGLGMTAPSGVTVKASGFYDGIGVSDFDTYGGKIELTVPFQ